MWICSAACAVRRAGSGPTAGAGCASQHHPAHLATQRTGSASQEGEQDARSSAASSTRYKKSPTDLAGMHMVSDAGVWTPVQPSHRARAKSSRETASATLALDGVIEDLAEDTSSWMAQRLGATCSTLAVTQAPALLNLLRRLNYPDIENLTTCFHMTGALRPDRGGRSTPTTGNNTRCCVMP